MQPVGRARRDDGVGGTRELRRSIRRIRPHGTRHICGPLLAALDVRPRIAMRILRHSEIAVTMEVYTHVPSDGTRRALRKLGKALDGNRTGKAKKKDQGAS